jgi:hypothetical protein
MTSSLAETPASSSFWTAGDLPIIPGSYSITVGNGNDSITGGALVVGSYSITVGDGNDIITGGSNYVGGSHYSITAGDGNDIITGGSDIYGGYNITAGNGDDIITGGEIANAPGIYTITAGNGNDTITGGSIEQGGGCIITVGNGNDIITGGSDYDGSYTILAGNGNDSITGGENDFGIYTVTAGNGNDTITGGSIEQATRGAFGLRCVHGAVFWPLAPSSAHSTQWSLSSINKSEGRLLAAHEPRRRQAPTSDTPEASVDCHWFAMNFGPYVRHVLQHLDKTTFETIFRNFPATRTFYFDQDHGNDVNKGLQGCTSLLGFLVVIAGCWKEVIDAINNVIAENENLFVSLHCHGQVPRGKKRRSVGYLTRNGC